MLQTGPKENVSEGLLATGIADGSVSYTAQPRRPLGICKPRVNGSDLGRRIANFCPKVFTLRQWRKTLDSTSWKIFLLRTCHAQPAIRTRTAPTSVRCSSHRET